MVTRTRKALTCLGVAIALSLTVAHGFGGVEDDETPSIEEIMQKLHKGADSPLATLKKALRESEPDWDQVQEQTKLFAELGASLPKNDPPKGDKADFEKLADAYAEDAKALDDAAKDKDKDAATAAFTKVSTSCMPCHKAHRP